MFGLLSQFDLTDVWCWILFPAALAMAWGSYLWLLITGRNPLVLEDRSDVPWGLIDVVLLFASMMLFLSIVSVRLINAVFIFWTGGSRREYTLPNICFL